MDLNRSFDVKHINNILNDPAVRPDVADLGDGYLDIGKIIHDKNTYCLFGEHGGTIFFQTLPATYEVHTVSTMMGRGSWISNFVTKAGDWMFTRSDAYEIITRIPSEHTGAKRLAEHAGMMFEFRRPNGCKWRGKQQDSDIYSFRIQDWGRRASSFEDQGRNFHDFLHREADRLGIKEPTHVDDADHNRYVGQAMEMVLNGQPVKGVSWFNRVAIAARYSPATLLSVDPLLVKMDIGILRFDNGEMRVDLPC